VSVRLRLAAWFMLVMAVLVVATSAITYAIVRNDLHGEAHRSAKRLARTAARGEPTELRLDGLAAPGDRIWLTRRNGVVVNSTTGAPGHTMAGVRRALRRAPSGSTIARVTREDGGQAIVEQHLVGLADVHRGLLAELLGDGRGVAAGAEILDGEVGRGHHAQCLQVRRTAPLRRAPPRGRFHRLTARVSGAFQER